MKKTLALLILLAIAPARAADFQPAPPPADVQEALIAALKNGQTADLDPPRSTIELGVPALLPDDYIYDPQERLVLYQRLAQTKTEAELQDLAAELIDRFGKLPAPAKALIARTRLKQRAEPLAVEHISMSERETRIRFADPTRINPEPLLTRIQNDPAHYRLNGNTAISLHYPAASEKEPAADWDSRLAELEALLTEIAP